MKSVTENKDIITFWRNEATVKLAAIDSPKALSVPTGLYPMKSVGGNIQSSLLSNDILKHCSHPPKVFSVNWFVLR